MGEGGGGEKLVAAFANFEAKYSTARRSAKAINL